MLIAAAQRYVVRLEEEADKARAAETALLADCARSKMSPGDGYWKPRLALERRLEIARGVAAALAEVAGEPE